MTMAAVINDTLDLTIEQLAKYFAPQVVMVST